MGMTNEASGICVTHHLSDGCGSTVFARLPDMIYYYIKQQVISSNPYYISL